MQKKAFTLVELIVVITILAILGTIAFISLNGYSLSARDSARISDMNNIEKGLTLFNLKSGYFPDPTGGENVTYSGETVWNQGTIGDSVIQNVEKLSKKPVDPLTGSEYAYSRLNTKNEFQIAGMYEGDDLVNNGILNESYAGTKVAKAIVKGNYNGLVAKVNTGSTTYILAVPTIISGDMTVKDIIFMKNNNKLVYNNYTSLPDSYKTSDYNTDGDFIYNPNDIVVYTGSLASLLDGVKQISFISNLQLAYSGTTLTNINQIKSIINLDTVNNQSGTKTMAQSIINSSINNKVKITTNKNPLPKSVVDCEAGGTLLYGTLDGTEVGLTCEDDIIVCSGVGVGYTISACNAGATTVYTNQTFSSLTSPRNITVNEWAGGLYQWGNNADNSFTSVSTSLIGTTTNNSTYSNSLFVNPGFNYPYDWTSVSNVNLWGFNLGLGTELERKGPCSDGYHIPERTEWIGLVNAGDGVGKIWNRAGIMEGTEMSSALKLPLSGDRSFLGLMQSQGNIGFYWLSEPSGSRAGSIDFRSNDIDYSDNNYRFGALAVRCFKNN